MKKILSLLVVLSIILSCAPVMAQRNISLNGLPDVLEVKYEDSFSAAEKDTRIGLNGAQYDSENGVINLPGANDNVDFYFRKNTTEIAGVYTAELSFSRESADAGEVNIVFMTRRDGSNGTLMNMKWKSKLLQSDNGLFIGNDKIADGIKYNTAKNLKLTVKFDTVSGTSSIWVNEKLAVESSTEYFPKSSVQKIRVTKGDTDNNNVRVNDFRLYTVPVDGMPIPDEIYTHHTFDKDSANVGTDYPVSAGGSPTFSVENDALYVTNPASGNAARVMVTGNKANNIGYAGQKLFVEYTVSYNPAKKLSNRALTHTVVDPTRGKTIQNQWKNGNIITNGQTIADSEYGTQYSAKYTYLFDTIAKTYSLWINNKPAFTDVAYFSTATTGTVWAVYFEPGSAGCALEDVKVGAVRDFVPDKFNVLFKEEFNSAEELAANTKLTMSEMSSTYTWGGSQVTAQATSGQPYTRAVVKLDKSDIKGNIYFNFVVGRNQVTTGNTYARLFFGFAKDEAATEFDNFARMDWTDAAFYLSTPSPVISGAGDGWITSYSATASLDCIFKFDVTNSKQSLYVNGKSVYENIDLTDAQKAYLANGAFRISLGNMEVSKPLYIRHLEIWQEDGKNAMRITDDNKLELMLNENADNLALYVAGYGEDDSLDKISLETLNLKKGKVYSADITDFSAFSKIKTFLWENNASLKPLVINAEK